MIVGTDGSQPNGRRVGAVGLLRPRRRGVASVGHDVEEDAADVAPDPDDGARVLVELALDRDVEGRVRAPQALVRELRVLVDHLVHIDRLGVSGLVSRVRQHPLHDAVGPSAVLAHLAHVHVEVVEDLRQQIPVDFAVLARRLLHLLLQLVDQLPRERGEVVHEVERIADLVRDAGGKRAERGELLLHHDLFLRAAETLERILQGLVLGLDLAGELLHQIQPLHLDGVLAEHFQGARHVGHLVVALDAHLRIEVALGHAPRGVEQVAQAEDQRPTEGRPRHAGRADRQQGHAE